MFSFADVRAQAASSGLNLCGAVDPRRFDGCQPKEARIATLAPRCGTMVVLGSGGRALSEACALLAGSPPSAPAVERHARRAVDGIAKWLRGRLGCEVVERPSSLWSACRLGEAAGFGTVSPVSGLLLHPEFGPWLQVRGVILVEGQPFGPVADASITDTFQPCCGCARPCVTACPCGVHDEPGRSDFDRCDQHRHAGGCPSGCRSRMACPLGSEHRDRSGEVVHAHSLGLGELRRSHGLGLWSIVPRALRGRIQR